MYNKSLEWNMLRDNEMKSNLSLEQMEIQNAIRLGRAVMFVRVHEVGRRIAK